MCFGISEQEIEDALSNTKAAFGHGITVGNKPANLEQCVKALNIAVDTLSKVKRDGKRTLNKDQNINLQKEVLDVYIELTQLQSYSGPDKAQKCFEFAAKWRNGMNVPGPIQPQPQPQPAVHESERSVDNASVSSGGSLSIPDRFYQASLASRSDGIDSHDEDNSNWDTHSSSKDALNVSRIEEPNDCPSDRILSQPARPRENYEKHTGCFADAAPRTAISDVEMDYLDSSMAQTKERDEDAGAAAGPIAKQVTTTSSTTGNAPTIPAEQAANTTQITIKLSIMRYERADASAAVPSALAGTVVLSKFRIIAPGEVDIDDTAHSHAEEIKAPNARRTVKWMRIEAHWKREAGMLQHLRSDRYTADQPSVYSLPTFFDYRYVSVMGSFSRTLDSYMKTERLTSIQTRQLTASLSDALRWCHEHHVVHLDIRPVSFFLDGVLGQDAIDGNGQLVWKLWNFGHSRFVGENVDTAVTTVNYAAPEILNGRKNNDPNVLAAISMDRWSLGLIIYELYARKPYFSSGAFAESQLTQDGGAKFEPNLDAVREQDAAQAIRGLLEVDPERRYTHDDLLDVYFGRT
ncbi:hypothetical protein BGX34_012060 [Mortierella sp. NVP85]|nr:hypothetical protein BGX34_012060 [Mortierella sp. NVP85]